MSTPPRKPSFPAQVLPGQARSPARPTPKRPAGKGPASIKAPTLGQTISPRPGPAPLDLAPAEARHPAPAMPSMASTPVASAVTAAATPPKTATTAGTSATTAAAANIPSQDSARQRMVSRLNGAGLHPAVLQAMQDVPRHRFIDTALIAKAYEDNSLPIGFGQTISKPSVVARMLSLALQAPCVPAGAARIPMRVLEIGTGCGYQAAVLSRIASEVYSIERVRGLHERARDNLRPFRVHNLHLLYGDGMLGYAAGAPYAAIVSAAGGEHIPQAWIDQLAIGGRIIAPTSTAGAGQQLIVVDKTATGVHQRALEAVHFVPLKSGVG